jgi:PAS domain S-box-containing protein
MRSLLIVAGYVAVYVALDWVSYIHPLGPFAITPWNPPPGLSLALLLVYGLRFAPALVVAGLAAELIVRGWPTNVAATVLATAVVAAGYAALAVALRRRIDPALASVRDAAWFVGLVAAATILVAAAYVAVFAAVGQVAAPGIARTVFQFWVGDAIGILVTTPVLAHLLRDGVRLPPGRRAHEAAAQAAALAVALWLVFGVAPAAAAKFFYVLFLPLIWVSVRHGAAGAAFALLAIQLGTVAAVQIQGLAAATLLEFQLFMSALAVTGLFLGALVSERSRAQDALEAREAQLTTVFETAPDGILVLDGRGRIVRANGAAGAMLGVPAPALAGTALRALVPGVALDAAPLARTEYAARRGDGSGFPVEMAIGRTAGGAQPLYIAVLRDVSDRKAIEGQLRERETELARSLRLAAAAETASALAHELNQPLSAIGSYVRACTLLLERPEANRARLESTMRTVVAEVGRAGEVVRRLRDFFRSGTSRFERLAPGALAHGALEALAPRLERHRIEAELDLAPGLPDLQVDRLQIETVLHNLLSNAIDAIVAGECAQRRITLAVGLADTAVRFAVTDSGPGVPAPVAANLFRPFSTTKPEGMGLGLAISRSIVENHGGRLVAEPTAQGASFAFTLPVEAAPEAARPGLERSGAA